MPLLSCGMIYTDHDGGLIHSFLARAMIPLTAASLMYYTTNIP